MTKLEEQEDKLSELNLKAQTLAEEDGRAGELQKLLDTKKKELEPASTDLEASVLV